MRKANKVVKAAISETNKQYFVTFVNDAGEKVKMKITGNEIYSTLCPECSVEHTIPMEDFIEGFGKIAYYCGSCASSPETQKMFDDMFNDLDVIFKDFESN